MNDEFGDPLRATHDRPFKMNKNVLKLIMPFRMQIRYMHHTCTASFQCDLYFFFSPISGASGSGKTTFILQMLRYKDSLFLTQFVRVIYCYPFEDRSLHTKNMIASYKKVCSNLEVRNKTLKCTTFRLPSKLPISGTRRFAGREEAESGGKESTRSLNCG